MVTPNPISREGEEADEPVPLRSAILSAAPWSRILVWFLRTMAIVWLIMGLVAWADILGVATALVPFDQRTLSAQSVVVYFAVIDLVAAIGLWLTSTWGGVMWLLALMSRLILVIFFPAAVAGSGLTVALFACLVAIYLSLSWLAAHEEAE
jgi:hypothetical protein